MNSFERYMGMARGEKVDVVPRIPILMHFAAQHIKASYADFARDPEVLVKANQRLVEDFGFDQLDVMSDPWREMVDFGGRIEYLAHTVPRCVHRPLEAARDLSLLKKTDPGGPGRMGCTVKAVRAFKAYGWKKYSITGWVEGPAAEASNLRGVENFMLDLFDDETFAHDLMGVCVDNAIAYARAQIREGADTIGIGDAIASQISAPMYDKFVWAQEKRLVDGIREAGGMARLHICGDINHLLPSIATLGVDILDCDWMVDMAEARRLVGPRVVLTGNPDPVEAIMKSTPEKIQGALKAIYERVGNPYFVNAGCEIPVHTPPENLQALCAPIAAFS
jgi:MtaA/CmuA family methyltransferase